MTTTTGQASVRLGDDLTIRGGVSETRWDDQPYGAAHIYLHGEAGEALYVHAFSPTPLEKLAAELTEAATRMREAKAAAEVAAYDAIGDATMYPIRGAS